MRRRATRGDDHLSVTLRLKSIDHLFATPDLMPFDPMFAPYSFSAGVDFLLGEMQRSPHAKGTTLTVLLPPEQLAATPDLETRTREAIARYAHAWLVAARLTHDVELRQARTVGVIAVLFFFIANLLSLQYARTGSLFGESGDVLDVLLEGLSVGAWVALWWPLDQVYGLWQHRLEEHAYRSLPDVALRILPDPDASAPSTA